MNFEHVFLERKAFNLKELLVMSETENKECMNEIKTERRIIYKISQQIDTNR